MTHLIIIKVMPLNVVHFEQTCQFLQVYPYKTSPERYIHAWCIHITSNCLLIMIFPHIRPISCIMNNYLATDKNNSKVLDRTNTNTINFRAERFCGNLLSVTLKAFKYNLHQKIKKTSKTNLASNHIKTGNTK